MKQPSRASAIRVSIFTVGILVFATLIVFVERETSGDDVYFANLHNRYPELFSYVQFRYSTWSGRLLPEIFLHTFSTLPLIYWRIMSVVCFAATTLLLWAYYNLVRDKHAEPGIHTTAVSLFIVSFVAFMSAPNVTKSVFWVTGAMNYAWLAPLFLLALYAPLHFTAKKQWPHASAVVAGLCSVMLVAASNEQAGLFTTSLLLILLLHTVYTHWPILGSAMVVQKNLALLLGFAAVSAVGTIFVLTAPGNAVRLAREYEKFMPEAGSLSLIERADEVLRWFLHAVVHQSGYVWVSILVLLCILLVHAYTAKHNRLVVLGLLILLGSALCILLLPFTHSLHYFSAHWLEATSARTYVVCAYWLGIIVATVIAPLAIYRNTAKGWLLATGLAGFYATIAVIGFSPTMYWSGWRTLFIPSIIAVVIVLTLLNDTLLAYPKKVPSILSAILVAAAVASYIPLFLHVLR